MAIAVGDLVQLQVRGDIFSQRTITGFWYRVKASGSSTNTQIVLDALLLAFKTSAIGPYAKMKLCISDEWNAQIITAQQVTPIRSALRKIDAAGEHGARLGATASNLAYTISKSTDLAGRDQLGSWHLPGVATADMDGGETVAAIDILLKDFADAAVASFTATATGTLFEPVIVGRTAPPIVTYNSTLITQTTPRETIRTMRRRTVNVGI